KLYWTYHSLMVVVWNLQFGYKFLSAYFSLFLTLIELRDIVKKKSGYHRRLSLLTPRHPPGSTVALALPYGSPGTWC
mgnify:CR=1